MYRRYSPCLQFQAEPSSNAMTNYWEVSVFGNAVSFRMFKIIRRTKRFRGGWS